MLIALRLPASMVNYKGSYGPPSGYSGKHRRQLQLESTWFKILQHEHICDIDMFHHAVWSAWFNGKMSFAHKLFMKSLDSLGLCGA